MSAGIALWRVGKAIWPPLGAVVLLAWPLAQLLPLPLELLELAAPERARELARFAAAGVAVDPRISLYPYATAKAWFPLAAAVAVYVMARGLCRRSSAALWWLVVAVMALGMIEAAVVVRQYLGIQWGAGLPAATEMARGTFGNRNLAAAWMEGCYGASLGALAARIAGRQARGTWLLAALAVVTLAVAVLCTSSRAGIAALAAVTVVLGIAYWKCGRRGKAALLAAGAATMVCAAAVGLPGLSRRYALQSLAAEKEGRLAMWADAARAAWRYFPAGSGAGTFPYALRRSHPYLAAYTIDHPHNEYLETAVEWGIPAAGAMALGMALAMWKWAHRLRKGPEHRRWLGWGCLAGAASILLHAAVDFPLRIPSILLLFALLLGMASGASARRERQRGRPSRVAALAVAVGASLAVLNIWWKPGEAAEPRRLEAWNAEAHYRAARGGPGGENHEMAAASCRRALEKNPYAAPLWREQALFAEVQGERAAALAYSALAEELEPHTRRGEWSAANLRLRLGDTPGALRRFASLAVYAPEMRRPAWETCWASRLEPQQIFETAAASPEALRDYCQYLAERCRWEALVVACERLVKTGSGALPTEQWRDLFDRLFAAGAAGPAIRLWVVAGGQEGGFANCDLERPLRGLGFDWVVRAAEGVVVERRSDGQRFRLDVEFRRPQNIFYGGVTHDFAVEPGRRYRLRLQAAAEEIGSSSGVQVEVVSHRRRLAVSKEFRRTSGWQAVELRFEPGVGEGLCRLRVIRALSERFDNKLNGRFSLRRVRLEPAAGRKIQSASSVGICGAAR